MALERNDKAQAWDLLGGQFWSRGRTTARPSVKEVDWFLNGLEAGQNCMVIGASTKSLIEMARHRGLNVTVLDFSRRMCGDLEHELGGVLDVLVGDITRPISRGLLGRYDAVLSDRLLNRFDEEEAGRAIVGMLDLLRNGGVLRTSVRLGMYPMDIRMIDEGKRRGNLNRFYDETAGVIDYSAAGSVLSDCVLPHGRIDEETLLGWYRLRGREKRFDDNEVRRLIAEATSGRRRLVYCGQRTMPDADDTRLYIGKATV